MSQTSSTPRNVKADISRIVKYAPVELIGRESETALLNDAWAKVQSHEAKRPHILTFVALGGEGKTSLVAKWAADLAFQDWPGCDAVFAWSFYSQGTREQNAASSDLFLAEALTFFGDAAMAGSPAGAFDKGRRLAQLVGERRALLILDGLEPLQYAPTSPTPGELKDQGIAALLKGLASNSHGLCVVTTRYVIPDLRAFIGKTVQEEKLTRLSREAGVALLQALGVKGSLRKTIPAEKPLWNEYEKLVEDVKGHALTLNLLGSYLRDAHAGDIRQRDLIKLEEADAEEQGGHAFRVMDAYVQSFESGGKTAEDQAKGRRALALLQVLGLFDRPAAADCLKALWQPPAIAGLTEPLVGISEAQRNLSLKRLEDAKLLTVNRAEGSGELITLDAHPLLREYFARRLRQQLPEAWRAAHRRLYEHLCATTPDKPDATLEDLQPLFQAIHHGCLAGDGKDAYSYAYWLRINSLSKEHGIQHYSTERLGAYSQDLGAVRSILESNPNADDLEPVDRAKILYQEGVSLRALGRNREAVNSLLRSKAESKKVNDADAIARTSRSLADTYFKLGQLLEAAKECELALVEAKNSGNLREQINEEVAMGSFLRVLGQDKEASKHFSEAKRLCKSHGLGFPVLCSWLARNFAELELKLVRTYALRVSVDRLNVAAPTDIAVRELRACKAWIRQAELCLEHARGLVEKAEATLVLARAQGFLHIFGKGPTIEEVLSSFDAAVSLVRSSRRIDNIPHWLIDRAWFRVLNGQYQGPDSAQADLDEAWEIASYSGVYVNLADVFLYRARLFGPKSDIRYPWTYPDTDLAEARRLIEQLGYMRRMDELEDAEFALQRTANPLLPVSLD